MPENNSGDNGQSFRGPLKYVVETSAPQLEAGRNTSIFLLITNPYDLPVTIVSAQTKVPVEFKDAAQETVSFWRGIWKEAIKEAILEGEIANDYNEAYDFMVKKGLKLGLSLK